jgi:Tol biopolymer transport system component
LTTNKVEDVDPCYSPDGKWIAFASNRVAWNNYEIFVFNPITFAVHRITFDPGDDVRPTWSPGKDITVAEIAFQTDRNGDYDIYKFVYASSQIVPVLNMDGDQIDPCYSPDGSSIIFAWDETEYFNLYTIPWDGNKEFLFKRTSNNVDEWSPYWGAV